MPTMKEQSRQNWLSKDTTEHLSLDCLQRIADATELMAKEHSRLIADRDYYKMAADALNKANGELQRRIAGLRGQITKLKKESENQ